MKMRGSISDWIKVGALLILTFIVTLNLPYQIDLVDTHDSHAIEFAQQDSKTSNTGTDCHVSGACAPMQVAPLLSMIYTAKTFKLKTSPDAFADPEAHLMSLDTPPPRV